MVAASTLDTSVRAAAPRRVRGRKRVFYASPRIAATTADDGHVVVDFSMGQDPDNLAALKEALAASGSRAAPAASGGRLPAAVVKLLATAFEKVAERYLQDQFSTEFEKLVAEYRLMLRENLATGDDAQLKAALNRARLQERILAATPMADQAQACELLGLSGANPSATMKRKEDKKELLRFTVDGRAVYPLLQFDVEGRRIHPALGKIIARKPDHWTSFRLLHWLIRPHLDFEHSPGASLGNEPEAVIAAFAREIEPEVHG
ncbi:hypothetical protein RN629_14960 [Sphingomonadaceae bacterium jetA1]|jgi:hypothetical protein|uniref:hypothetical protein n=1 Tax=Facivitalis istanbulensis TaxID=3075838 RepID=UPI00347B2979